MKIFEIYLDMLMSNVLEHTFLFGTRKHNEGAGVLEVFYQILHWRSLLNPFIPEYRPYNRDPDENTTEEVKKIIL